MIEALSKPMIDHADIFGSDAPNQPLKWCRELELHNLILTSYAEHRASGPITSGSFVWTSQPSATRPEAIHWETVYSAIREVDGWIVRAEHMKISEEQKRTRIEEWGGPAKFEFVEFTNA